VKAKTGPGKKPPKKNNSSPRSRGKKITFEDGVKAALIAGAIVCAAVIGAGGFFLIRSVLSENVTPPSESSALDETAGAGSEAAEAEAPAASANTDSGLELLPELEAAIQELGAESADGTPGVFSAPQKPPNESRPGALPPDRRGILIFVIDDAGNNLRELEGFLSFPGPLTMAVLPGLSYSAEAAKRIRAAGKEVFLHQPMEPLGSQDPGPGAIKTGMSPSEVKAILEKNLAEIWPVAGLNNHEGSRATMDPVIMRAVLETARDKRICFLDSKTIADTASPGISKELAFPIAQRDIFLDNEQDRESIIKYIEEGCKKSEQNGYAIMIGHTWSPKLAAILTELYPGLVKRGYYLTTVSAILDPGK
jgi:polysaccharide deacetylase 2 family uncharacterized protein YibQ